MKKFKLGILPYIIILCMLAFAIIKIRDTRLVSSSIPVSTSENLKLIDKEEWNRLSSTTSVISNENSLVIYNPEDENSIGTYKNIKYVLDTIGVNVVGVKVSEQKKYKDISDFNTMVICIDNLNDLEYTSSNLQNWVKARKRNFFYITITK